MASSISWTTLWTLSLAQDWKMAAPHRCALGLVNPSLFSFLLWALLEGRSVPLAVVVCHFHSLLLVRSSAPPLSTSPKFLLQLLSVSFAHMPQVAMQIVRMWSDVSKGTTEALQAFIARTPLKVPVQEQDTTEEVDDVDVACENVGDMMLNSSANAATHGQEHENEDHDGGEEAAAAAPAAPTVDADGWEVVTTKKSPRKKK